jgi:hypothetical protein
MFASESESVPNLEQKLIANGWPAPLAKAAVDRHFDYAIGLRNGTVVRFQGGTPSEDMQWITIDSDGLQILRGGTEVDRIPNSFSFERGLAIRVSEIMWAADAPEGS